MPYSSRYIQQLKQASKSDAKGIEGIIYRSAAVIQSISYKVNTIFYGKGEISTTNQNNRRLKNPLDMGILPLLDILTSVDACELVNYALDKARSSSPGGSRFNPKSNPPSDTFGKIKWSFQKTAFDVQTQIDGFYNEVGNTDSLNLSEGAKVLNTITQIKNTFASFTQAFSIEDTPNRFASIDPDIVTLLETFPQLRNVGNYINDSLSFFDKFADFRQLQNSDIQRAVTTISKIRQYCVLIQSLNNPVGAALAVGQGAITSELNRLLKDIDVQKLVPILKGIGRELKKVLAILNSVKSIVDLGRLFVRIFLNLIFAFKIIIQFLKLLPIPNIVTAVGITTTAADVVKKLEDNGPKTFEVRLSQVNTLLDTVTLFLNTTLPLINETIQKINALIASIERCQDSSSILPSDVIEDVKNTNKQVQASANDLQAFLDKKKENDLTRSSDSQLGEFTINIITEQVIEETFGLRRRYGVALNNAGVIQVQSQPTFASDDNVIINEVKQLLQQKGIIKQDNSIYTDSELNVINEPRSYLADDNIDIYPTEAQDTAQNNELVSELRGLLGDSKRGRRIMSLAMRALTRNRQTMNQQLTARNSR